MHPRRRTKAERSLSKHPEVPAPPPSPPGSAPHVAIACQGGGTHAAFGAGVLLRLLEPDLRERFQLVGLSGTSGGALSAALIWRGLVSSGAEEAQERCLRFWQALAARQLDVPNFLASTWDVWSARTPLLVDAMPYLAEPFAEPQLRRLIAQHMELERLTTDPDRRARPKLFIGATDMLEGDRIIFQGEGLDVDQLVASAAVPPLFRAIEAAGHRCWDGLFTTNAPVREFTDILERPDELWVIQVNPQRRPREPRTLREIKDRTNELSGNLSLAQELYFIDRINQLLTLHPDLRHRYRHIRVRVVQLDAEQLDMLLDIPSKLDRRQGFIEQLLEAGRERAEWFLDERSAWPRERTIPARSVLVPPMLPTPRVQQGEAATVSMAAQRA